MTLPKVNGLLGKVVTIIVAWLTLAHRVAHLEAKLDSGIADAKAEHKALCDAVGALTTKVNAALLYYEGEHRELKGRVDEHLRKASAQ